MAVEDVEQPRVAVVDDVRDAVTVREVTGGGEVDIGVGGGHDEVHGVTAVHGLGGPFQRATPPPVHLLGKPDLVEQHSGPPPEPRREAAYPAPLGPVGDGIGPGEGHPFDLDRRVEQRLERGVDTRMAFEGLALGGEHRDPKATGRERVRGGQSSIDPTAAPGRKTPCHVEHVGGSG